jgi:hypothetical protein
MYEGGPFCDLVPDQVPPTGTEPCFDAEFQPDACSPADPSQDPTDWSLLQQLADQIAALPDGGFYPAVEGFFDFDEFLSSFAVTAVLADWDGYEYGNINNYRVYHDPSTDRWSMIQAGIDNSFDSNTSFDSWSVTAVLAQRCMAETACATAYAAKLEAAAALLEQLDLGSQAEQIHTQIWPDIMTDPRKEVSADQAQAAHDSMVTWIQGRPQAVRDSIAAHGF